MTRMGNMQSTIKTQKGISERIRRPWYKQARIEGHYIQERYHILVARFWMINSRYLQAPEINMGDHRYYINCWQCIEGFYRAFNIQVRKFTAKFQVLVWIQELQVFLMECHPIITLLVYTLAKPGPSGTQPNHNQLELSTSLYTYNYYLYGLNDLSL